LFLLFFFGCQGWFTPLQAQVVNTEERRFATKDSGWTGAITASFEFRENINSILILDGSLRVQYRPTSSNRWLLLGSYYYWRSDRVEFFNNGYLHLRRTWRADKFFAPEAFLQTQRNLVFRSDLRSLAGAGMRYNVYGRDTGKFHISLGTMYMFEYEDIIGESTVHRDHRASTYASFYWNIDKKVKMISSTYYLPNLRRFEDYRIRTDTQLQLQIFKWLQYKLTLSYLYDTRPPGGIPRDWFSFQNGISTSF
jgi:hypothetical protein